MDTLSVSEGCLIWRYNNTSLHVQAWGVNSLRIRAANHRLPSLSEDWALLEEHSATAIFERCEHSLTLINGDIRATVDEQGRMTISNQEGKILLEEFWRQRDNGENFWASGKSKPKNISALKISAREFISQQGDRSEITLRFESDPNEKLFGMGQYQQPFLNLKGCTLELAQRNSQASVPFVISDKGYGFLWNNPAVGEVMFAKNETRWRAKSSKQLDYWVTAASTPSAILHQYCSVTGKPPEIPDFALGLWQSKLRYKTQEELLTVARRYHENGIALAVIVADFFHWTNQGEWRFDEREWPDPLSMTSELKAMGTQLMVSVWPTVDTRSDTFQEMNEKGFLVNTKKGLNIQFDFLGNTRFFDPTNPDAREYLWNKIKENYVNYGIRLFWLDEAEPEFGAYDFDNYRYFLGDTIEVGNIYPALYAKTFYDGLSAEGSRDAMSLVRCAWAGSQRYGALVWSGDIHSSFDSMKNQLCAGLNMGMAGIPLWTTDIGGFHGGHVEDPEFHELLIRWFQWAVFCPVLRMHGHRDPVTEPEIPYREGIAQCNTGAGNELWSFGDPVFAILSRFVQLREKLRPYLRELMDTTHRTGEPLMRPLFFDFPSQDACWLEEEQYMFGPDILVAPVLHAGQRKRDVFLPSGVVWCDVWTRQTWEGGQRISCECPLDRLPLFVRQGAAVMTQLSE